MKIEELPRIETREFMGGFAGVRTEDSEQILVKGVQTQQFLEQSV